MKAEALILVVKEKYSEIATQSKLQNQSLEKYLSKEEMESFKNGETGIFSITVSGYEN